METALLALHLFGMGVLGVFAFWRYQRDQRAAAIQRRLHARRLAGTRRRLAHVTKDIHALARAVRLQNTIADRTRARLEGFIDGPVSQRSPKLIGGSPGA